MPLPALFTLAKAEDRALSGSPSAIGPDIGPRNSSSLKKYKTSFFLKNQDIDILFLRNQIKL